MRKNKISVSITLTEEVNDKLKALAKSSGRSRSAYIRQILRRYIQYVETKDSPRAQPVNWDLDKPWTIAPSGVPEEQKDK